MARDLLERDPGSRDFLRQAEDRLHLPLKRLMLDGPEAELQATENAQAAILFHSVALLRLMSVREFRPANAYIFARFEARSVTTLCKCCRVRVVVKPASSVDQ